MAERRAPGELTLNAWDAQFWMQLPLPLAEVGSRLAAAQSDYLDRLLKLLEDAVALTTALALVRLTADRAASRSTLEGAARDLVQPSLGKRIALLLQLERAVPGSSGWDLQAPAPDFADLFGALTRPHAAPRAPCVRDVLEALTQIRNDDAHRRLPSEGRLHLARIVERAVFNLIRRNRALYERLLHVDEVRTLASGDAVMTATSLNGPTATSYRRGNWQPTGPRTLRPERIYLGEPGDLIDAHPFLVMRGGQVFVLDEVRRSGPILRNFLSRARLDDDLHREWAARWPECAAATASPAGADDGATVVDPVPPLTADPVPTESARHDSVDGRSRVLLVASAGALALGMLVILAVVVTVTALHSPAGEDDAQRPTAMSTDAPVRVGEGVRAAEGPRCRARDITRMPLVEALPQIFSGAPIGWGSRAADLESACGPTPPHASFSACRASLVDMRSPPWGPTGIVIPHRSLTTLAFHRGLGLFEVMVFSSADVNTLAAAVAARLGPHHRQEGSFRFWEYPRDAPIVRIKVAALPAHHTQGRSAVKVHLLSVSARYSNESRALGCP